MKKQENLQELASEEVKNNFTFKRLLKGIKTIGVISLASIIGGLVVFTTMDRLFTRYEHIDRNSHYIEKPVGLFSFVSMNNVRYKEYTDREFKFTEGLFFSRTYIDKAKNNSPLDAKSDEINISQPFKSVQLYRDTDYDLHKEEFDKGDKILAREEPKYSEFFGE